MIRRTAAALTRCLVLCAPMIPLASQGADTAADIQFSEPGRKVEFHPRGEIEPPRGAALEFLDRGNSLGGVISGGDFPTAPSGPAANPRLLEFFNRQFGDRRLRFDGTEAPDSQIAFEQALGVNPRWSSRTQGKPSESDQFSPFNQSPESTGNSSDGRNARWNRSTRNRPLQGSQGITGLEAGTSETGSEIQTTPSAFDLNRPLAAGVVLPTAFWNLGSPANRPGETPSAPAHPPARVDPQERRPESLRSVLAASGGINPLAAGFDPINLNVDVTRQPVNPVIPVSPLAKSPNPARNPLFDSPESTLDKRLSPSESRSLDLRIEALGSSSLAPSISTPAPQPVPRPFAPGPTPFPTRRF